MVMEVSVCDRLAPLFWVYDETEASVAKEAAHLMADRKQKERKRKRLESL
jgi:hypothetical protein